MANLTVTIDEEVLKKARLRALEQGTSVNALVAEMLGRYARVRDEQELATRALLQLAASPSPGEQEDASARQGRSWTRDDLHER